MKYSTFLIILGNHIFKESKPNNDFRPKNYQQQVNLIYKTDMTGNHNIETVVRTKHKRSTVGPQSNNMIDCDKNKGRIRFPYMPYLHNF